MKWQTMFKGDYLTAIEFAGRTPTFTIVRAVPAIIEGEDGKKKQKGTVQLLNVERPWVLCKTTAQCLAAMFGEDVRGWEGKRVTLYEDPNVRVGKEIASGIRVLGSPDLPADKSVAIKLPRKKAFVHLLKRTAPVSAAAPTQPVAQVQPPPAQTSAPAPFEPPSREEVAAAEAEQAGEGAGF